MTVLGAGAWGTTVAALAAGAAETRLWALELEVVAAITERHENTPYLAGFTLPDTLEVTDDLAEALDGAELVVVAVPSRHLRHVTMRAAPWVPPGSLILSVTKGIEVESGKRMTEVLEESLPDHDPTLIGVLSGPNLASEIMAGEPSATCVAFVDTERAIAVQQLLTSDRFRVYTSSDVAGCEIGGAVKNVIAIAAGVADGLGYGMNTKAALITRGLAELSRLGVAVGGHPLTFLGLAGNGDLIATCSSPRSRNHYLGEELAKGRPIGDILAGMTSVAEGVETAPGTLRLARRHGVEMPISETVGDLLAGRLTAGGVLTQLMRREPRAELHGLL
ncbi:MAG TPA: NAD(P)H-dependent glycerol-3-phosphate dehydrogenase [Acidimicrobiales bacterium]|nr:NAD(P)H-dependent glycerol-3-phosphate dehydrogenase [Acidimicrobiales bacterium]